MEYVLQNQTHPHTHTLGTRDRNNLTLSMKVSAVRDNRISRFRIEHMFVLIVYFVFIDHPSSSIVD